MALRQTAEWLIRRPTPTGVVYTSVTHCVKNAWHLYIVHQPMYGVIPYSLRASLVLVTSHVTICVHTGCQSLLVSGCEFQASRTTASWQQCRWKGQTVSGSCSVPSSQMTVVKGKECGQVHILHGNNKPRFRVEKKLKASLFQATLDHVRNEDVLLRVKEQRNILHEIRKRKAN